LEGFALTGKIPNVFLKNEANWKTNCAKSQGSYPMAKWPYNTARWQRLRKVHLSMFPLCEECEGIGELQAAQAVDHRKPISDGGEPFPSHNGLASLCYRCHSAKTARGVEAGAFKTKKPRKGCSIDGQPLDRKHPWHPKKSLRAGIGGPTPYQRIELIEVESDASDLDDRIDHLWV
jgi:5-methylcytosine-specific restriction enzyme A